MEHNFDIIIYLAISGNFVDISALANNKLMSESSIWHDTAETVVAEAPQQIMILQSGEATNLDSPDSFVFTHFANREEDEDNQCNLYVDIHANYFPYEALETLAELNPKCLFKVSYQDNNKKKIGGFHTKKNGESVVVVEPFSADYENLEDVFDITSQHPEHFERWDIAHQFYFFMDEINTLSTNEYNARMAKHGLIELMI